MQLQGVAPKLYSYSILQAFYEKLRKLIASKTNEWYTWRSENPTEG
jgi:hypothetical protein